MSAEQLAVASLAVPPNDANAKGSSLYPQGSTFNIALDTPDYDSLWYFDENGTRVRRDNCPAQNTSEFFCPNINQCTSTLNPAPTDSPSMNQMFGFLTALAIIYTLLAAYWAQVFPGAVRWDGTCVTLPSVSRKLTLALSSIEWRPSKVLLLLASQLLVRWIVQ